MLDARVPDILREAGAAAAWLFGSRARGAAGRDTDLAVLCDEPLGLLARERVIRRLEEVLGTPVDVVDFLRAPLELRARIVVEGQLVFSDDEPWRVRETVRTQSLWEDVRRSMAEPNRAFLDRVAAGGLGRG